MIFLGCNDAVFLWRVCVFFTRYSLTAVNRPSRNPCRALNFEITSNKHSLAWGRSQQRQAYWGRRIYGRFDECIRGGWMDVALFAETFNGHRIFSGAKQWIPPRNTFLQCGFRNEHDVQHVIGELWSTDYSNSHPAFGNTTSVAYGVFG